METLASASSEAIYFHHLREGHDERGAFSARGSPDRSHDDDPRSLARRGGARSGHDDEHDDEHDDDDDDLDRSVLLYDPLGLSDDSIRRSGAAATTTTATQKPVPPPPGSTKPQQQAENSPVGSPAHEWWQKAPVGDRSTSGGAKPQLSLQTGPSASPTKHRPGVVAVASDEPSASSDARSPAADFLKAFASLHTVTSAAAAAAPSASFSSLSEAAQSLHRTPSMEDASLPHGSRFSDLDSSTHSLSRQPSVRAGPSKTSTSSHFRPQSQLYASGAPRTPGTRPALHSMASVATTATGSVRPDDEGARFGPEGRYLLGRAIGYGGFSVVRQGWDLGTGEEGSAGPGMPEREPHRVAIKLVQRGAKGRKKTTGSKPQTDEEEEDDDDEAELRVWESLPAHPNLLPLLFHEDVQLPVAPSSPFDDAGQANEGGNGSVRFLVMPYCDAGSLLDHVRREGLRGETTPESAVAATPGGSGILLPSTSLSRSASLRSATGYAHPGIPEGLVGPIHPRTGSGFVPRTSAAQRIFSDPPSAAGSPKGRQWTPSGNNNNDTTAPATSLSVLVSPTIAAGVSPSAFVAASLSAAGAVGLARRDSSIGASRPRSRGLGMSEARQVMRQLVDGMLCLHRKARVRHGDLKLENVLGQRVGKGSRILGGGGGEQGTGEEAGPVEQPICWRIADFGLARPLGEDGEERREAGAGDGIAAAAAGTSGNGRPGTHRSRVSDTAFGERARSRSVAPGNRGGSMAYAPPETFSTDDVAGMAAAAGATATATDAPHPGPDNAELAADMWALGCIMYALLSGRLPFSDSFEPRLQLKIQKAQWEMPVRLLRRAERQTLAMAPRSGLPGSPMAGSQRSSSLSFFGSPSASLSRTHSLGAASSSLAGLSSYAQQRQQHQPLSTTQMPPHQSGDLSASVPATAAPGLPPAVHPNRAWGAHDRAQSASVVINSGTAVNGNGSADAGEPCVRSPISDHEEDPASDQDDAVDSTWDGKSLERAAAREALRGLLEPDVGKRWNIDRLANCTWLRQGEDAEAHHSHLPMGSLLGAPVETDGDIPASLRSVIAAQSRPSRSREPVHPTPSSTATTAVLIDPPLEFSKREPRAERPGFVRRDSSLSRSRPDREGSASRTSSPMPRAPSRGARPGTSNSQRSEAAAAAAYGWQPASPRFPIASEAEEDGESLHSADHSRGRSGARPIAIAGVARGGSKSRSRSRSRHGYPRQALIEDELVDAHGESGSGAQAIPSRSTRQTQDEVGGSFRGRGTGAFSLHHHRHGFLHQPMPQHRTGGGVSNPNGHGTTKSRSMSRSSSVDIIGIRGVSRGRAPLANAYGDGQGTTNSGSNSGSNSRSQSRPRLLRIVDDSELLVEPRQVAGGSGIGAIGAVGSDPNWGGRGTPSSSVFEDAAAGTKMRGRGRDPSPLGPTVAQRETATRSSTSRSRSRAPVALRNLLQQQQQAGAERGDGSRRGLELGSAEVEAEYRPPRDEGQEEREQRGSQAEEEEEEEEEEEIQWWQRGRKREPRSTRH